MPYARLSLRAGKSAAYLRDLSDSLHQAQVEAFDVPLNDRFQVIHQLAENELVFDRTYLAGPRSDDFVLIAITAGRERSTEQKKHFYRCLVDRLSVRPGLRREDVMVVITTTRSEDWSFGNGIAGISAEFS